jgi:hypothetical protein
VVRLTFSSPPKTCGLPFAKTHFSVPRRTREAQSTAFAMFSSGHFPQMLIFDFDYTIWPVWADTEISPPIKAEDGGQRIVDESVPILSATLRLES